jgi:hypothetical protein
MHESHEQRERPASREAPEPPRPEHDEAQPELRLASAIGNRAFGALLGRAGDGILPEGRAHPDVEAAIARSRGGGSPLDPGTRERLSPALGDPLSDVRVHTDDGADALTNAVAARAFATGSDVFFAQGEYRPGSPEGERLLAHELTHVVQQRGAPTSGPLEVSQPGDPLEVEAERTSGELAG